MNAGRGHHEHQPGLVPGCGVCVWPGLACRYCSPQTPPAHAKASDADLHTFPSRSLLTPSRSCALSLHTRLCAISPICVVPETAVLEVCAFFEVSALQQARSGSGLEVDSQARHQPCIKICSAQAAPARFHSQVGRRKDPHCLSCSSVLCLWVSIYLAILSHVCVCVFGCLRVSNVHVRGACVLADWHQRPRHTHTDTHRDTHTHKPSNISQIPQSCLA